MAGPKGSKYYDIFLRYNLMLENVKGNLIFDDEGFRLLVSIDSQKSIVAAAREMHMSYRKAWGIIRRIEEQLGFKLVKKQRGGVEGGMTLLTPDGHDLVEAYTELTAQFDKSIHDITKKFFRKINAPE